MPQTEDFDYRLPLSAIAQRPAQPRDAAKVLVYNRATKRVTISRFRQIAQYLPHNAVLVFNDTKVIPARISATKPTGGKVELLYLESHGRVISALSNRRLDIGAMLRFTLTVTARVLSHSGSEYKLQPNVPTKTFLKLLASRGQTPLPPYLRHSPLTESERRRWYQTVFAKHTGSVAAPTASLHFTPTLLNQLRKQGIAEEFVNLSVGLGTFAPVTSEQIQKQRLHHEQFEILRAAAARLNRYKSEGRPIIAVGTTVARTLESASRRGRLNPGRGSTQLFIQPGYHWRFVDGLITNFHVPKSSLLMLTASLVGRKKLFELYQLALKRKMKFLSFGDGMLIR